MKPTNLSPSMTALVGLICFLTSSSLADDVKATILPDKPLTRIHARAQEPVRQTTDGEPAHGGLLARELVRQAILIGARDEMGLPTRDSSLEDKINDKDPSALEIQTTTDPKGKVAIEIRLGNKWKSDWKYETSVSFSPIDGLINYQELSEKLEALSRNEFPNALKSARFEGQPPPSKVPTRATDETTQSLLDQLSPLSQVGAVRRLHAAIKKEGESPEVLEGLARGYANLAMLTHRLVSTQPTVFAARGLLYSARLAAQSPDSARGLWSQAYVLGMIGCDRAALDVIKRATERSEQTKETPPEWSIALEAKCKYDPVAIQSWLDGEETTTELIECLHFQSMGAGEWTPNYPVVKLARAFLANRHAGCMPIARLMAYSPNINDRHTAIPAADEFLRQEVSRHVGSWEEMPNLVQRGLASDNPLKMVPKALVNVGLAIDPGEPSARSIGRMILELNIIQFHDRLAFQAKMLAAPYSDIKERYWPEVTDHPLAGLIMFGVIFKGTNPDYLRQNFSKLPIGEARFTHANFVRPLIGVKDGDRDIGQSILNDAMWHADDTTSDMVLATRLTVGDTHREFAKRWLLMSPHRPAAAFSVDFPAQDQPLTNVDEWVARFASRPETTSMLIELLRNTKHVDEAIAVLKKAIPEHEDPLMYLTLASLYKERKQFDDWRETLDEMLLQPEQDLRHTDAQNQIAQSLMEKGDFEGAKPYAEAAADSYSTNGLMMLAICEEGLKNNDEALRLYEAKARRYPYTSLDWYLACVRLMSDKREEAKSFIENVHHGYGHSSIDLKEAKGLVAGLEGNLEESAKQWEDAFKDSHTPYDGAMAALTWAESGKPEERDRLLTDILANADISSPARKSEKEIVQLIKEDLANKPGTLPQEKIDKLLAEADDATKLNVLFFLGWHLTLNGQKERGAELLQKVADGFVQHKWVSTLASARLKEASKKD